MKLSSFFAGAALAAVVAPASLSAATISGADALREWNLIVFNDLNSSSEVEGRTFVGGNLNGNSSNYRTRTLADSVYGTPGLTVVGNVTGNAKNLNNGAGASVGGNVANPFNLNGPNQTINIGGTYRLQNINGNTANVGLNMPGATYNAGFLSGLVGQRDTLSTSLTGLSAELAARPATDPGIFRLNGNRATFTATESFNVVNLDGSIFSSIREIDFQNSGTTIVNVSGASLLLDDNFVGNASQLGGNVLWNFFEATDLTFTTAFRGSVLAPLASAHTRNMIEGTAVFSSLRQDGKIALGTFNGAIPALPAPPTAEMPVPEPATWAMLLLGFGFIGLILRRRRGTTFSQVSA